MKYREKRESDKSKDTIVNVNVEHYEFERIKKSVTCNISNYVISNIKHLCCLSISTVDGYFGWQSVEKHVCCVGYTACVAGANPLAWWLMPLLTSQTLSPY